MFNVKVFTTYLVLALALNAGAQVAHANVSNELERATRTLREQAIPCATDLERALRLSHTAGAATPAVRTKGLELLGHLRTARAPLIEAGLRLTESDYDSYFAVALDYYRVLERLLIAKEAGFGGSNERVLVDIENAQLEGLRLTVPTRAAELLGNALAREARARQEQIRAGQTPVNPAYPDLIFRPTSGRNSGTSTVEFSGNARERFGLTALETYPSTALANDRLRMYGIGMTLTHLANIERLLPHNERPGFTAPTTLNSADQAFLNLKTEEAHSLVAESDFRASFISNIIPMLHDVVDYSEGSSFRNGVDNLKPQLVREFSQFVDQNKVNSFSEHDPSRILVSFIESEVASQALLLSLLNSSESFHKLSGELLKNTLRHTLIAVHGPILVRLIGCFYFRDQTTADSVCLGGNTPEQVFVAENGWTTESLTHLNTVVTSFLSQQYQNIPDSVLIEQERLRELARFTATPEARDRLVKGLLQGSLALENIDRTRVAIAQETARTLDEDTAIAAATPRMQSLISPEHLGSDPINPAVAMIALATANFIQNEIPIPQWYGDVLAQIAIRSTAPNATPQIKQTLNNLLYGPNNMGRELTEKLDNISILLGNISAQIMTSPEATAASMQNGCSEEAGIFSCMSTTLSWLSQTLTDAARSRTQNVQGTLTLPDDQLLVQMRRIKRSLGANPSIGHVLSEIKNRTQPSEPIHQVATLFQSLLRFADVNSSSTLAGLITSAFDQLVDRSNGLPFMVLQMTVFEFNRFLAAQSHTISALFLDAPARDIRLKDALRYRLAYEAYLNLSIQSLEQALPGLFYELPVPSFVHSYVENAASIPLYKVFAALHRAAGTPAMRQVVEAAMGQARQLRTATIEEGLRTQVPGINLRNTLSAALQGSIAPTLRFWFLRLYSTIAGDSGEVANISVAPNGVLDAWWPTSITLGDALVPAIDRAAPSVCTSNERTNRSPYLEQCTNTFRIARVLGSAFIKPYLLAAHKEDRDVLERLANSSLPLAMAYANRAIEELNRDLNGTMVVDGVDRAFLQAKQKQEWLEQFNARMQQINRHFFNLFMGTQLVPQHTISQSMHFRGGLLMFAASFTEMVSSVVLTRSYQNSFTEMRELGLAHVLPGTLAGGNTLAAMRDRVMSRAHAVQERLPGDLLWMTGIAVQMRAMHQAQPAVSRETRLAGRGRGWRGAGRRGGSSGESAGQARDYAGSAGNAGAAGTSSSTGSSGGILGRRVPQPAAQDYRELGVNVGETNWQAIRSSYRRLALRYHPDHNPGDATAAANFRKVTAAFERIQGHLQSRGLWDPPVSRATPAEQTSAQTRTQTTEQTGAQTTAQAAPRPASQPRPRVDRSIRYENSTERTHDSFYALDIQPGTTYGQARRIYQELEARRAAATAQARAAIEPARAEVRALEGTPGTEALRTARARLQELQSRLDRLERGYTTLGHHWRRVNTEYARAGRNRPASVLMERPGQEALEAAFLRIGATPGETYAQIAVKHAQAQNRILTDLPVAQRQAALEALTGHLTTIQNYFSRLQSTVGLEVQDLTVPAWTERLITPPSRRLTP